MSTRPPRDYVLFPGVVVIDNREQRPFAFTGLRADAIDGHAPLIVRTQPGTLVSGDYSLIGFEGRIACERKSLSDLFGTIGQGRKRFTRELERLNQLEFAAVVVEADWSAILCGAPHSQLPPKVVYRSIIAWSQRFVRCHWFLLPTRRAAENATFRILERFWKDNGGPDRPLSQIIAKHGNPLA